MKGIRDRNLKTGLNFGVRRELVGTYAGEDFSYLRFAGKLTWFISTLKLSFSMIPQRTGSNQYHVLGRRSRNVQLRERERLVSEPWTTLGVGCEERSSRESPCWGHYCVCRREQRGSPDNPHSQTHLRNKFRRGNIKKRHYLNVTDAPCIYAKTSRKF